MGEVKRLTVGLPVVVLGGAICLCGVSVAADCTGTFGRGRCQQPRLRSVWLCGQDRCTENERGDPVGG